MTRDAEPTPKAADPSQAAGDGLDMRELRLQRNLKIVVASLGVLIVAGLLTVVGRIIYLASHGAKPGAAATASVAPAVDTPLEIALELPKGARIVSMALTENRLAVHHESPNGTGIAIIDTQSGARLANVTARDVVPSR